MTQSIFQGIVIVQVLILALTIVLSFTARSRGTGLALAWANTMLGIMVIGGAIAVQAGILTLAEGTATGVLMYGIAGVVAAALTWAASRMIATMLAARQQRYYDSPETRSRISDELRDVLRSEGIELDARLAQAERDREQFLYTLEERHARQIAGLAKEYQHEAHTILTQLLDQLVAERLQPMVEQRLTEQREALESELGAIDTAVAGETLTTLRTDYRELAEQVEAAASRIEQLRKENPDSGVEELANRRMDEIEAQVAARLEATQAQLDEALAGTITALDARIAGVGALLDEKVEAAGNPLAARMADTERAVDARFTEYGEVLTQRFAETEELLNQRIHEQEHALEQQVSQMEQALEQRLASHGESIEQLLSEHDSRLQDSLAQQAGAVSAHAASERDRLTGELSAHTAALSEQVAGELATIESDAREAVATAQDAWNRFTEELEQRFAETRQEALRAAGDIARSEREALEREMLAITEQASGDIADKVEKLGREAAWQRAQVERTVTDHLDLLRDRANEAVSNADSIFADLDRIGAERVSAIRQQAEDALVQSRDYVAQLQDSLGSHLEALRERSGELAHEMNERLGAITMASQDTAARIEAYAREIHDSTTRELSSSSEMLVQNLQARIQHDMAANLQSTLDAQRAAWEQQLNELSQRVVQAVHGDLAGAAEHARSSVAHELEHVVAQAREQVLRSQEQSHMQVMNELARQSSELGDQARHAAAHASSLIEEGLRDSRRQLEEAMASMGAHMREELVRFQDEGRRRVDDVIGRLRTAEQDMIREEDRKLTHARNELVRQHEGAMQDQMRSMMTGLSGALGSQGSSFTASVNRPSTPLTGTQPSAPTFGS